MKKPRLYNGSFLKVEKPTGGHILGWFPSHSSYAAAIASDTLFRLREENKALMIIEDDNGDSSLVEVHGFSTAEEWIEAKTPRTRKIIEEEIKKSKYYLAG